MKLFKTLKFQIAAALLLITFLFWGGSSLSLMALEEQRGYNTLLNITTRLEQTVQNMVTLGMNYSVTTPGNTASYNRDGD